MCQIYRGLEWVLVQLLEMAGLSSIGGPDQNGGCTAEPTSCHFLCHVQELFLVNPVCAITKVFTSMDIPLDA